MNPRLLLTDEQREEIRRQDGGPIYVVDPATEEEFVLLSAADYQQYCNRTKSNEFDIAQTYVAQEQALADVWDKPELDEYNDYDRHRSDG